MLPFYTFEGPEGSGKSTQVQNLHRELAADWDVLAVREPGGTELGELVRSLLLDREGLNIRPRAETLLFAAARAQLVETVIRPALEAGKVVLCDRYTDSTLAYQGYGHGQSLAPLRDLNDYATAELQPALRFYLNLDPGTGLRRIREGCRVADIAPRGWNRMDALDLSFHERVHAGYAELIRQNPKQWVCVDASLSPADIQERLAKRIRESIVDAPARARKAGLQTEES